MMKAIIVLAMFIAAASAVSYCVDLVTDDVTCEGFRTNWPAKACYFMQSNFSSATVCDSTQFYSPYSAWSAYCPLKNVDNATFCQGEGYFAPYFALAAPCGAIVGCTSDDDCNPVAAPVSTAPMATPPLACYDCCLYCYEDATCTEMVNMNDTYTKSDVCTACMSSEPTAAPTSSGSPSSGPSSSNAGAVVVVSTTVLAFAAALLL